MRAVVLTVLSIALAALGCRDPFACTRELRFDVTPRATSIAVGQSFVGSMSLSSCGGREKLTDTFIWRSDSPQVASVDATGRVRGLATGAATVTVESVGYGATGSIQVTVNPF